jgi:hypothetical protein
MCELLGGRALGLDSRLDGVVRSDPAIPGRDQRGLQGKVKLIIGGLQGAVIGISALGSFLLIFDKKRRYLIGGR